jgi:hypothetical protein
MAEFGAEQEPRHGGGVTAGIWHDPAKHLVLEENAQSEWTFTDFVEAWRATPDEDGHYTYAIAL